jgi:hypothetical protein
VASPTKASSMPVVGDGDDEKGSNEAYKDFFANLMKKGRTSGDEHDSLRL